MGKQSKNEEITARHTQKTRNTFGVKRYTVTITPKEDLD
jgi:hypothetical protein